MRRPSLGCCPPLCQDMTMPPLPSPVPASSTPSPPPRPPAIRSGWSRPCTWPPDPSPARGPLRRPAGEGELAGGERRQPHAGGGGPHPSRGAGSAAGRGVARGRWPGPSSMPAGTCPMCLSALVMNGIQAVYYAFDNDDAAPSAATAARPTRPATALCPPPPAPHQAGEPHRGRNPLRSPAPCISAASPGQRRLAGAGDPHRPQPAPFLTAIGPWPSHRREAGPG